MEGSRLSQVLAAVVLLGVLASLGMTYSLTSQVKWIGEEVSAIQAGLRALPARAPEEEGLVAGQPCPLFVKSDSSGQTLVVPKKVPCLFMFSTTTCTHCINDLAKLSEIAEVNMEAYLIMRGSGDISSKKIPSWMTVVRDEAGSITIVHGINKFPTYIAVNDKGFIEFVRVGSIAATGFEGSDVVKWLTGKWTE